MDVDAFAPGAKQNNSNKNPSRKGRQKKKGKKSLAPSNSIRQLVLATPCDVGKLCKAIIAPYYCSGLDWSGPRGWINLQHSVHNDEIEPEYQCLSASKFKAWPGPIEDARIANKEMKKYKQIISPNS